LEEGQNGFTGSNLLKGHNLEKRRSDAFYLLRKNLGNTTVKARPGCGGSKATSANEELGGSPKNSHTKGYQATKTRRKGKGNTKTPSPLKVLKAKRSRSEEQSQDPASKAPGTKKWTLQGIYQYQVLHRAQEIKSTLAIGGMRSTEHIQRKKKGRIKKKIKGPSQLLHSYPSSGSVKRNSYGKKA